MLFNSYGFIFVFLPMALVGWSLAARHRGGMAWLAAVSLAFYAWWNWHFLPILLGSVAVNYLAGRVLALPEVRGRPGFARGLLAGGIAANLAALASFKYAALLADAAPGVFANVALPIGISFFTFTQIAYLVDTARSGRPERSGTRYLVFVAYFPHLIAGPLLHHGEILPQLSAPRRPDHRAIAVGLTIFIFGLFKKVVLADGIAPIADAGFDPMTVAGIGLYGAWASVLAYTLQIYFDFSGYSDMAIGLSLLFGIRLPVNFESPYQATSIAAFWRRWHMTLSRFLRDYLYVPLGGSRRGPWRHYLNLMATMLLGGIWHGAGWNFLIWGGLHGAFLTLHHGWCAVRRRWRMAPRILGPATGCGLTLLCVMTGWVFFRAADPRTALAMFAGLAGRHGVGVVADVGARNAALLLGLLGVVLLLPNVRQIMARERVSLPSSRPPPAPPPPWARPALWRPGFGWAGLCFGMFAAAMLQMTRVSAFLYFQF
jgi:alginate O-acetyltransferase complex protein AlgI